MHQRARISQAFVLLGVVSAGACGTRTDFKSGPTHDERVPIAQAYLDRAAPENGGLLVEGSDGLPVLEGDRTDPAVLEARRFYDTVQVPNSTPQAADVPRATAPLTFDDWKHVFGFAEQLPGESLVAWRSRVGVVVYYNQNELGLGRELGCSEFADGSDGHGGTNTGIGCFVTNYGTAFEDMYASLRAAVGGGTPKNTVCITYRPSLGANYEVQFYVYGRDGKRQDWAQLDTLGPRPHPQVCTNCHGGHYDAARHLVNSARFLPLDPAVLRFSDDPNATRGAQEERIRALNVLALRTPLSPAQKELFTNEYGGHPEEPGRAAQPWAPASWADSNAHRDLYLRVVKPYCGTCHLAMPEGATGLPGATYQALTSPAALASFAPLAPYLCALQMPNAQPTMRELWRWRAEPLTIGDREYHTAGDALLADGMHGTRDLCTGFDEEMDCRRSVNPDGLCGDSHSGTACNPDTGQCVPVLNEKAPINPTDPNGVCKLNGSRSCPWSEECQSAVTLVSGYDGACTGCGAGGQRVCANGAACQAPLTPTADGVCAEEKVAEQ